MAKAELSFEDKVKSLTEYWYQLREMAPENARSDSALRQSLYSGDGFSINRLLSEARASVAYDIGCHASREYYKRGFGSSDLHKDKPGDRRERSDILAVMTVPLTAENRDHRTERIEDLLEKILAGNTINVASFVSDPYSYPAQTVEIDPSRPLFGVFNPHISDRALHFRYDTPEGGETALHIGMNAMFVGKGIILEPAQA